MIKDIFNWHNLSKWRSELYGFTALWIVIFHFYDYYKKINFPWTSVTIFKNGYIGVDIFLFLSAISLYFSMKKDSNVKAFYKKRFQKILKVYFLFCIPYLFCYFILVFHRTDLFFAHATFTISKMGNFWFLSIIMLVYFCYPIFFRWLEKNQEKRIWMVLIFYILGLFLWKTIDSVSFMKYEICFTRFPIFLVGTLFSKKVYEKKAISNSFCFLMLLLLFMKGPFLYFLSKISYLNVYLKIFERLYLGVLAIGVIFLLIFELFELNRIKTILKKCGAISLEIYVCHMAIKNTFLYVFHLKLSRVSSLYFALVVYVLFSILMAKFLHWFLEKMTWKKRRSLSQK